MNNSAADINKKLASEAVIQPHAALKRFASHPDAIPSHARGMALLDKIDELIAEDELLRTKTDVAQNKVNLVKERINQRTSAVPEYNQYMDEVTVMANKLHAAVERHSLSEAENIPFYRLLKEEILKNAPMTQD